jgi:hypothetical protein
VYWLVLLVPLQVGRKYVCYLVLTNVIDRHFDLLMRMVVLARSYRYDDGVGDHRRMSDGPKYIYPPRS